MDKLDDIPRIALKWREDGRKIALATVIETWGSAPRRVGAQLVIDEAGEMMGSVSGGCVEGAVIFAAQDAIESGASEILEFGVADEDAFAVGLACGGTIRILVQPIDAATPFSDADLAAIVAAEDAQQSVISVTDLESFAHEVHAPEGEAELNAVRMDRSQVAENAFLRVYNPPLKMVIIGAVHIAQALTELARINNFTPMIIDPRGSFATPARFPDVEIFEEYPDQVLQGVALNHRTAIVALTHDPKIDDPALRIAIRSDALYVGALGSKRTHAKRVERLEAEGFSEAEIAHIHAPIGLDIGAATPAEIATSIMAEILSVLRKSA